MKNLSFTEKRLFSWPSGPRVGPGTTRTHSKSCKGLAETAGAIIVGSLTQRREGIVPATYIGKGKLEELVQEVGRTKADVVIFDNELLARFQIRNIEKTLEIKVLDRSELILDIFATRARTVEAKLQVELAQLGVFAVATQPVRGRTCLATAAASAFRAVPAKPSSKKTSAGS